MIIYFLACLLCLILSAWATANLIYDSKKAGFTRVKAGTAILYSCTILIAAGTCFFLRKNKPLIPETLTKSSPPSQSAAETYQLEKNMTYVVGTMDEVMEWIQDNEVLYVQAIFQLNNRESLATWRRLQPEGVPSEESRLSHDNEEFLHYAVIPDKAIQAKTTRP